EYVVNDMINPYKNPLKTANATMIYTGILRGYFPIKPLIKPIRAQETTCHTVQIPIPSSIFDKNVVNNASMMAAAGPSRSPQMIISDVTGCMLGRNANTLLPTTASEASKASKVSL